MYKAVMKNMFKKGRKAAKDAVKWITKKFSKPKQRNQYSK